MTTDAVEERAARFLNLPVDEKERKMQVTVTDKMVVRWLADFAQSELARRDQTREDRLVEAEKDGLFVPDWDVLQWLPILIEAADHLLDKHNCDGPRYEEHALAKRVAKKWLKENSTELTALRTEVEKLENLVVELLPDDTRCTECGHNKAYHCTTDGGTDTIGECWRQMLKQFCPCKCFSPAALAANSSSEGK